MSAPMPPDTLRRLMAASFPPGAQRAEAVREAEMQGRLVGLRLAAAHHHARKL